MSAPTNVKLVDIECKIVRRGERSVAIVTGDQEPHPFKKGVTRDKWTWLPVSQIEIELNEATSMAVVTLPEWLATQRGLI